MSFQKTRDNPYKGKERNEMNKKIKHEFISII